MAGFEDYAPTVGNILTAGANIIAQNQFAKRNERWAREDATTAFNRQRQLLAEQRAYESPASQMQRYVEAGLNPNLIYGQQQGSISPPSVPQATTASSDAPHLSSGMFDSILQSKLIDAQVDNLNANTEKQRSEKDLTVETIDNVKADTWMKHVQADQLNSLIANQYEERVKLRAETQRIHQIIASGNLELTNGVMDLMKRSAYVDEEWDAYCAELGLKKNEFEFAVASFANRLLGIEYNNQLLRSQFRLNIAQAKSIEASLPFLERMYQANSYNAVFQAAISAKNYKLLKQFGSADKIFGYVRDTGAAVGDVFGGLGQGLGRGFMQGAAPTIKGLRR